MKKKRLGELLVEAGIITQEELEVALRIQQKTRERLGQTLLHKGMIDEDQLVWCLADLIGAPSLNLSNIFIDPKVLRIVPKERCSVLKILPVSVLKDNLTVAMADPFDVVALDEIRMMSGMPIDIAVASETAIMKAIEKFYTDDVGLDEVISRILPEQGIELATEEEVGVEQEDPGGGMFVEENTRDVDFLPVVRLLNSIIRDAIRMRASDIHIEPMETSVSVRYRIDGLLRNVASLPIFLHPRIASRIKILGKMDISEHRVPQDGRCRVRTLKNEIDLRISTLPTQHGENVAIRILNRQEARLRIENLGLLPDSFRRLEQVISFPQGILLLTGPTGSSKTTTLYSILYKLKSKNLNIVTLEDPIEYNIPGIIQTQTNDKAGLTFATGFRSILRQDPDVIMVGEIRDVETAEIAFNAALTGHLVLSTLHTNDSCSATIRLRELGISPYLITAGLKAVISQRLVRRLCMQCREPHLPDQETCQRLGINPAEPITLYRPNGCKACAGSGFYGRVGIYEILTLSEKLKEMIFEGVTSAPRMAEQAVREGMRDLAEDAALRVIQGVTSLEEVMRLVPMEARKGLCPQCQRQMERYFQSCPFCGFPLWKNMCRTCGKELEEGWRFCPYCAQAPTEAVPAAEDMAPAVSQVGVGETVDEPEPWITRCESCGMILKPTWTDCPLCLRPRTESEKPARDASPPRAAAPAPETSVSSQAAAPAAAGAVGAERISFRPPPALPSLLVVMDDPGALMEIRKAARDVGFSVIQVGSPEEALRRLDFLAPVGVIQETLLSGVDGLLLCRKLRAHHRAREVPIVVILSDGCPEEANRAREAGATVVLSRPIKPEDLRSTFQQGSAEPIAQSM